MEGVLEVHEQHFWQLVDGIGIASLHLVVDESAPWDEVRKVVTSFCSNIHEFSISFFFVGV